MLSALLGEGPELAQLKRLIIEKTQGTPFFMEETMQVLFDEGALARNGIVKLTKPLAELKIPPTVQAILASRVDQLPSDAKDFLQSLAVIGQEFPLSLIREVVTKSEDEIDRLLNDLQLGEFIYERPASETQYIFKNPLTQEVAYESVLIGRRKQLHDKTGAALESLYTLSMDDHFAELAYHYSRADNAYKAVRFLALAGKQALERSAFAKAQEQLQQGLDFLQRLPKSPDHDADEFALVSALAQVLVTRDFAAPEKRTIAERARYLAENSGNLAQLIRETFQTWLNAIFSGEYTNATDLANELVRRAESDPSPANLMRSMRSYKLASFVGTSSKASAILRFGGTSVKLLVAG
jgi:predicted ATPase